MKKLLSLLAVCSFGTIASTSVVACTKKPQDSEQETDPKEVIEKYNQDFEKRVEAKVFVVKDKEKIEEELIQQIEDLITIVSGKNKEVKFSKIAVELKKEDKTFDLNYTITVEKEVKELDSKDFSIKNQTYGFRTQLDELNEEFNEILLKHEFHVQDISDIEIPSDGNILGYLKIINKVNEKIKAIATEFGDTFKELNKENVEIIKPKVHLNLDLEKIAGGIIGLPTNSLAQEDNTMTIKLPAFVKYSLKDETNNSKVFLTQELEFSFKIPKIEILGFAKTNNKEKLVNQTFSSINLDKANEEFTTKLATYNFKQQEISIDVSNVDLAYILKMLEEINSIIENIKEEISTQFGNVEGVQIDNIDLGLDMDILSVDSLLKIFGQIKLGEPIEIPFVASYTLNGKSYFADNLKAQVKINLSE